MMDESRHEKVCPFCNEVFYPENKVVQKTFCGEESICSPTGEKQSDSECRVYDFCSEECVIDFTEKTPACTYEPGWKKLMGKINKASHSTGIAGARPHNIRSACK